MTPQGYPLWAVHPEGDAYAVVGWDVHESISYPYLVPLGGNVRGVVREDGDTVFRYTTTDPTARSQDSAISLDARMAVLADRLEDFGVDQAAGMIRDELTK
jgi:hypothetical protein